jgi:hypothetical protein
MSSLKLQVKQWLSRVPVAAEAYWRWVDQAGPTLHFSGKNSLERLESHIPSWLELARHSRTEAEPGKRLAIFATFRYWIEHAVLTGLTLAGMGHDVTLAYLPYARYRIQVQPFDLQRQDAYVRDSLRGLAPLVKVVSIFSDGFSDVHIPKAIAPALEEISLRDSQYSLRVEDVDPSSDLYRLRLARNEFAARSLLRWLRREEPDVFIVPNGSILEYGVAYHVARHLNVPVVTYEFDEPQHRIRLGQNTEVMREETDALWQARRELPLTEKQRARVSELLSARQKGSKWQNFPIQFQGVPKQGGEEIHRGFGLDERPVVLLAPNVFGDSATLGRQVFSDSMTEWLGRTLLHFVDRDDVQLLIRIHPSEARFPTGTSMEEVVRQTLPQLPEHIRLIAAEDPINTYDLVEIASLGIVYTTTVGLEMSLSGVPVVVTGFTHYRGKGFTLDPQTWEEYFETIERALQDPNAYRLDEAQLRDAWKYAYHFFFEFTHPFPWHLLYFWDDVETWPLKEVLGAEGLEIFRESFQWLAGEPIDWSFSGL